ncbi:MAG: FAD-dependent oxidoreductase [Candidatus Binatia bacterium]
MARHVIVGAGTAGWNAITTLRELDKGDSEIILVSEEAPYSRMVLPYYLAQSIGESHVYTANPSRLAKLKVETRVGQRAQQIDVASKKLVLKGGGEIPYDRLLIATGSSPIKAPVPGADGDNVHSFWTLAHARAVTASLRKDARVVVIGAGFISFTILNALVNRGAKLSVVELESRILPRMVDETGAAIVEKWLTERGVVVRTATKLSSIEDKNGAKLLRFEKGPDLEADLVIMATGIRPNIEWARSSGIEINSGILVDDHCRTSVTDIFAAGDIAEGPDAVTGERVVHAIEPTAMQHGRVAAANMAGMDTAFEGSLLMNIVDVLDLEIASFGAWDDPKAEVFEAVQADRPAYRKLLFRGGRVVGAILLGKTRDIWTTNDVGMLKGLVHTGVDLSDWKDHLRTNPFDVKRAFLAAGTAGRLLPKTVLGQPSIPAGDIAVSS